MPRKLDGTFIESGTITITQLSGSVNETSNAAYVQANAAYGQANTARSDANTTFATVNTTFASLNTSAGTQNTNIGLAYDQANNARSQANTARDTANSAYNTANTKLGTSGGSISGDLTISGNLVVQGNATTINVSNLSVNDSIILLATGSSGDADDIGFIGHIQRGGTNTHVGLVRKATENRFYLFDNYEVEPTNNVIDIANNNFRVANIRLNTINANSFVTVAGLDVTGQANAAYGQANTARSDANTTFATINTTFATLNTSAGTQNTNIGAAYTQANTATTNAGNAYGQANAAYGQANAAYAAANTKLNSSSYTASDVLSKLLTVDGAGSGIDADLLDGISSASFLRSDASATNSVDLRAPNFYISADTNNRFGQGVLILRSASPTFYFQDTDHNSAMLHNNSNLLYVLRGGNDTTSWTAVSGQWPFYFNLTNNDAVCGGAFTAVGNITAYSSDRRLKHNFKKIESAVDKVKSLNGYHFDWIDKVAELGFTPDRKENDIGLIAQEVEAVIPQAVAPAPFDKDPQTDGTYKSKSGEDYITINYDKLVPLLVEAIKEQQVQIEQLKKLIEEK
jgi:hypothetical protein